MPTCHKNSASGEHLSLLKARRDHIVKSGEGRGIKCDKNSLAGAVSQRACVYSGARVVLNPITDVCHLVHGPIGCASYTWDIRGALTSGPSLYRKSFSTDLREENVIFGGEDKLYKAILELVKKYKPGAVFVYATCIVGIIGDDIKAVCKKAEEKTGCRVVPIQSEGFKGNKAEGYKAACTALFEHVIGNPITQDLTQDMPAISAGISSGNETSQPGNKAAASTLIKHYSVNILGEFNVAGDIKVIKPLFERLGVKIVSVMTGDSRITEISQAHTAQLNLVQCSGSMTYLAKKMQRHYEIPFKRVSFFGLDDLVAALRTVADHFNDATMQKVSEAIIEEQFGPVMLEIGTLRVRLAGKRAAIYMGGAAKALALIRAFDVLGMTTVLVGTQSGKKEEYDEIREIVPPGTVMIDDANPQELKKFLTSTRADLLVAGVKERFLAYKLGIAFCDFNHDRTVIFSGFEGFLNFAEEVASSLGSPVWKFTQRRACNVSSR